MNEIWLWIAFNFFVITALFLDLYYFNRTAHTINIKEALITSGIWISIALIFNVGIFIFRGNEAGLNFLAGYLIEKSLSVDNLFVFLVLFKYFQTPSKYLHKVLFWGILGAIVMRAAFIFLGIAVINSFHWILYLFGGFLIFAGFKMIFQEDEEVHPENNLVLKIFKKFMPTTHQYYGDKFFVKLQNIWYATPLFIALLAVETSDLLFAVDSIPAVMAITLDPFIIYTSNIFAILGLRALFFALSGIMDLFHFLHYGLAAILIFVGIKMLANEFIKIPMFYTLAFIILTLLTSIALSLIFIKKK